MSHGAADVLSAKPAWHGPHEAPRAMTIPLVLLAAGAILAGFVGIPAALGGGQRFERFLEPSFHGVALQTDSPAHGLELVLMTLSIGLAAAGIVLARHLYVTRSELATALARRWARTHALLLNKYYVDELYHSTVINGTLSSSRGFSTFDQRVVDGAVNATGPLARIAAWVSHMLDKYVVDGLVNFVGWSAGEGSYVLRRLQTGLLQNYALLMLAGVFVFLTVFLFAR